MALFDSEQQKIILRVVYDGAERAGKTTNVTQLCGFFSTLRRSDVFTPEVREGRTIYFDWMQLEAGLIAGHRIRCQLLTVPGQSGLSRRRWQLLKTADVVVFVCESTPEGIEIARPMFNLVRDYLKGLKQVEVPLVLQANKQDVPGALDPHAVAAALGFDRGGMLVGARASEGVGVRDTVVLAIRAAANVAERLVLAQGVDALAGTEETGEALYAWMRGEEAHIIENPEMEREAREAAERRAREAAEQVEAERHAREAAERAEAEAREAAARAEAEWRAREAMERAENERRAREAVERAAVQAREAMERAENERKAREAAAQAEAERRAREAAEAERREQERAEAEAREAYERAEAEAREAYERAEAERQAREAAERAEAERQVREAAARAEAEAREAAARAEAERQAREAAARAEAERQAREAAARAEAERQAREAAARVEAERQAREAAARVEAERQAREAAARAEAERQAREAAARVEAERQAREATARAEADRQAREAAEQAEARRRAVEAAERAESEARAAEAHAESERQVEEATARAEMEARNAMARATADRQAREADRQAREAAARAEADRHAREAAARAEAERNARARAEAERAEAERRARDIAERQAARMEAERQAQAVRERPHTQRVGIPDIAREVARVAGERHGTIIGVPDPSGAPFKTRFQAAEAVERQRAEAARAAREAAERTEAERSKAREVMRSRFDETERAAAERAEADRRARDIADRQGTARLGGEPLSRAPGSEVSRDSMFLGGSDRQAKVSAERAEVERMTREAAERREVERRAREVAERVETERRTREAAEKAATERQAREAAVQAAAERNSREAAARADAQRRAREAAERAAAGTSATAGTAGAAGGTDLVPRGSAPFFVSSGGSRGIAHAEAARGHGPSATSESQPPPSSIAAGSAYVLLASGIEPPMPRADVGIGFIWPSATGRDILRRVMAAGPIVRRDDVVIHRMKLGSGLTDEIIFQTGGFSLKTSLSRRFADLDEGRTELLKLARKKMQTGRLVPDTAVLSIQPEEGGGAWLWSVMPWLPTLHSTMEEAAYERDEAKLTEALVSYAEGAAEALIVAARQRLILNVHPDNFARSKNDLYYIDDNISQGTRIPDLGHAILQRCVDYAAFPSAVNSFITMFATYVGRSINRKLMDELGVDDAFAEEALISPLARPAQEKLFRLLGR